MRKVKAPQQVTKMKVSAATFDLRAVNSDGEFWERVDRLMKQAADEKSDLVVLPEYFCISWLVHKSAGDFALALKSFLKYEKEFHRHFMGHAKNKDILIVAGSTPIKSKGKILNRSFIYHPKMKKPFYQDKQNMTRFEDEEWKIKPGAKRVEVVSWRNVKIGVAICYDIEFPNYALQLVKKNVDLILVPSCTDDVHGYWRVRHCAEARAVESQSYVAASFIVGGDTRYDQINAHHGQACLLTPCDVKFPVAGVLAEGEKNRESLITAEYDFSLLTEVRKNGTVLNRRDLK